MSQPPPAVENPPVRCDISGPVARLTLNRPDRRNPLSRQMLESLRNELARLNQQDAIRVIRIEAEGKVFCAGHDLKEMTHENESEFRRLFELCSETMQLIRKIEKPVLARVHALATAAGCQLVAACDLAFATPDAKFATPGVKIGLFCTTPMVPLVRSIPAKPAMEMLLTGKPISAHRAQELGLVNHVAESEVLDQMIDEVCQSIVESSPAVIALGKRAFYDQLNQPESDAYVMACDVMTDNAMKPDAHEGITAFLEKRRPRWSQN